MTYLPEYTGSFKKDYKLLKKRGYDLVILQKVVEELLKRGTLPAKFIPHPLRGNYNGFFECHIKPDWLLIWRINESERIITLVRTGTHSDLF